MPSIVPFGQVLLLVFSRPSSFSGISQGFRLDKDSTFCTVVRPLPSSNAARRRFLSMPISSILRLRRLIDEPVTERLAHQGKFGAVRQAREVAALPPRKVRRAVSAEHR